MSWSSQPRTPRVRRDPDDDPRPPASRAAVVGLLTILVLAGALAGPWRPGSRDRSGAGPLLPEDLPAAPDDTSEQTVRGVAEAFAEPPVDLGWLWSVVLVLLSLSIGLLVLHVLRRRRLEDSRGGPAPGDPAGAVVGLDEPDLNLLRRAVQDAAVRLRTPPVAADAIVAAWVSLEDAARRSGVRRDPAATPTEFTVAVLERTPADPTATRVLLDLYLRARFSDEALGPDDVEAARSALAVLAEGLASDPAGATADGARSPTQQHEELP